MIERRVLLRNAAFIGINVIVASVIVEAMLLVMLHAPRFTETLPRPVRRLVQQVYRHFNRSLIQFDPDCARYDPGLTYTLKPGECTFENIEFRTDVRVNRLGVRDDEASAEAPDAIVIGDSHAMGWGVGQEESFGRVLAKGTGLKVLNAAISSYGTVREMLMLDRLDVSRLRVLVLQYSDNDLVENRSFRDHGNQLPIASAAEYDRVRQYYAAQRGYYPGKYVYRLAMKALRLEAPEPDQAPVQAASPAEEAALFLNALVHAGHQPLDGVQLVVLEINEELLPRRPFIAAVDSARHDAAFPEFVQHLIAADMSRLLTPSHFFVLDDHMNPRGHRAVGEALADLLRTRGAVPAR
jgi:hypothetical protein